MSRDSVVVGVTIGASIETVWGSLTTGRGEWWPDMRFEPLVGSPLVETWIEEGRQVSASGSVTQCEEPRHLAFRWSEPTWEQPLTVDIRLVAEGRATSLTLSETGFVRARVRSTLPEEHEHGWRYHLERLKRASEAAHAPDPGDR